MFLSIVTILNLGVVALGLGSGTPTVWISCLLLWLNLFIFAVRDLGKRVYLAAFLLAFFIFLMGRQTLIWVFHYRVVELNPALSMHLSITIFLGLTGVGLGFIFTRNFPRAHTNSDEDGDAHSLRVGMRNASLLAYWLSLPFSVFSVLLKVKHVLSSGYTNLYSETYRSASATGSAALLDQFTLVNNVAFCVFLATLPSKRESTWPLVTWAGVLVLTLGSGQRGGFITGALFIVCYLVSRHFMDRGEAWISRKMIIIGVTSVPLVVFSLVAIETIRGAAGEYGKGAGTVLLDFLYNQGVSSTVITNAFLYGPTLPDQAYLTEFTHSGLLGRLFYDGVTQGNSIERALSGGSFTHSLSYLVLGENLYLSGRGTGSSFLAEGFADFGYLGVLLIGIIYGILIRSVGALQGSHILLASLALLAVSDVFWAPRGSATGFLMTIMAPSTLLAFAAIWVLGLAFTSRSRAKSRRGQTL